jgi:SAM-dependent methyltransferase
MTRERYTHGHHESVLRSHRWRTAENSAAYLLPLLEPGQRLLDVGCGPGTITADLAQRVGPAGVVAVDNAPGVLDACRETLASRGIEGVTVELANVYELPYADGSFDVVHAHQVFQHLSDPVAGLRELRRVCRRGGVVAVRDADYPAMAWYPSDPALDRWMELALTIGRANGAELGGGRHLLAWARAAGFTEIVPSASIWCFATPEDRQWWGGMWAERVTGSAFADQVVAGGHGDEDELAAIADAWRRFADDEDGWFVAPNGEVLCRP